VKIESAVTVTQVNRIAAVRGDCDIHITIVVEVTDRNILAERWIERCHCHEVTRTVIAEYAVLLTADHGFVDTTAATRLDLGDHPRLADTLVLPLCGEGRAVYCYVDPAKRAQFEAYVAEELGECCVAVAKEQAMAESYFGLGEPHPRLGERIGHYILLMKDNFVLRDHLLGEGERPLHIGVHGGVSAAEMHVPLVLAQL